MLGELLKVHTNFTGYTSADNLNDTTKNVSRSFTTTNTDQQPRPHTNKLLQQYSIWTLSKAQEPNIQSEETEKRNIATYLVTYVESLNNLSQHVSLRGHRKLRSCQASTM